MKLVQTLLVRDEADVVDAQIAFHLDAGVDLVVATDNRSQDGTTEILERYAREGHVHVIREPGEDLRQTEWVTRMARLAAEELGADWVFNTDADEFWWPLGGDFRALFAAIPEHFGVIRGAWRNFVPRPDDDRFFAERMTVRLCKPGYLAHPLATHFKSAHRARADVRVGRGNHEAFAPGLVPLRGWHAIEILHFPVRSYEHCVSKYVTQFVALERNAEKGIPAHMAEAYHAYQAGALEDFYRPLVVDDAALASGIDSGDLVVDTRLRDALRALGFGDTVAASGRSLRSGVSIDDVAAFAAECAVLPESDYGLAIAAKVDALERRTSALEKRFVSRAGRAVRAGLRR